MRRREGRPGHRRARTAPGDSTAGMVKTKLRSMEQLSRAIGVSRPTLSKYFTDPTSVRAKTRERIDRALENYEYRPNLLAANLNRRNSRLIGVVVPHFNDAFFTRLISVTERFARRRGYQPISLSSHGSAEHETRALDALRSMNAAGAILAPIGYATRLETLVRFEEDTPLVVVDSRVERTTAFVGTDNHQSIGLITEFLCGTGAPPAFLSMPRVNLNSLEREHAYLATMERLGFEPRIIGDPEQTITWEFERYARQVMLDRIDRGLGGIGTVLCANDRLAFGALSAACRRRVRVGYTEGCSLRIAGHDDQPLSRYFCPSLTTVPQSISAIAVTAIRLLIARMNAETDRTVGEIIRLPGRRLARRDSA